MAVLLGCSRYRCTVYSSPRWAAACVPPLHANQRHNAIHSRVRVARVAPPDALGALPSHGGSLKRWFRLLASCSLVPLPGS